ncbi:hypothetical protein OBV_16520 [Oscillibacter valericigenes Sjm18-20]|nr:hypothetical protein OBV_16520 [Oscillibacter valericigenes Sjm18-20]
MGQREMEAGRSNARRAMKKGGLLKSLSRRPQILIKADTGSTKGEKPDSAELFRSGPQ